MYSYTFVFLTIYDDKKLHQWFNARSTQVLLNQTWPKWSLRLIWMVPIKIISDNYKLYPKLHPLLNIKFLYG
jgi:hypothetical protein